MALKTGEIRALITGDYTSFRRATALAKAEAKRTRDELSQPIIVSGDAKKLLGVLGGLPAAGTLAGAGMAAGLALPSAALAAIGVMAVSKSAEVQAAYGGMAAHVSASVQAAAQPLIPYLTGIAKMIEQRFNQIRPQLDSMFEGTGPHLQIFADGVLDFTQNLIPGMQAAIERGRPVTEGFARFLAQTGQGVSNMMSEWAESSDSAGRALDDLGGTVEDLLTFLGRLTAGLADDFGPRFGQVQDILGDAEEAVADFADGVGPVLSGALDLALDGVGALLAPVGALAQGFSDLPAPIQAALLGLVAWRAMQSRLVGEHDSLGQRLAQPWKRFGDEVRVQTALAAMSGHENLSRLAASMSVVEARVPFIGRMAEAYRNASTSVMDYVRAHASMADTAIGADRAAGAVGRLGAAAVGTAAAVGSGLKSAATGLIGVLGGPWGLAISAGVALLGMWVSKQQEAAAKQRESAQAANEYARALRESNGVVNESIRKMAVDNAEKKGALKTAKDLGIAAYDLTNAVMNQGGAYDNVRGRLEALVKAHSQQVIVNDGAKSGMVQYKTELDDTGKKAQGLLNDLGGLNSEWTNGTEQARRVAEALGLVNTNMAQTPAASGPMAAAMQKLADISATAEDKISALKSALDELAGKRHTVEEANQGVNDSLRAMGDAFKAARDEAGKTHTKLLDGNGVINTVTESGSRLQDNVMQLADAYRQQFSAVVENAQAQGKTLPEAVAIATAATSKTRDNFMKAAEAAKIAKGDAERLAAQYGIFPEAAATAILQPGMLDAIRNAGILQDKVIAVPNEKTVIVSSTTPQQIALLETMGFKVKNLPGGRVEITSNAGAVESDINHLTRTRRMSILLDYQASGIPNASRQAREAVTRASGGVMEYYAAGGLRPMSSAVPAIVGSYRRTGVMRVIADNPIADEAFIPLIRSSARAQSILDETIRRMRPDLYALMQQPLIAFSNGGVYDISTTGRASSVDRSRHVTYQISGQSPRAVRREIEDYEQERALLYGA